MPSGSWRRGSPASSIRTFEVVADRRWRIRANDWARRIGSPVRLIINVAEPARVGARGISGTCVAELVQAAVSRWTTELPAY